MTAVRPPPLKDRFYIVNSHYSHYGQSVLHPSPESSQHSALTPTSSAASLYSGAQHKRQRLMKPCKHQLSDCYTNDDDAFAAGEVEEHVLELGSVGPKTKQKLFNYRSLINPDSKVKRFLTKLDPDAFSLFSSRTTASATINSLPTEVLKLVVSYASDYKTQVSCLYVNHNFYYAAKPVVYEYPLLTSSYRVAQLISSLKEFGNGQLIKTLDLSHLSPGVITRDDDTQGPEVLEYAMASWRDWKYRDDPLYGSLMLNSYTLSKSKSNMSTDSAVSMTSSFSKILSKWNPSDEIASIKRRFYKWRQRRVTKKKKQKHMSAIKPTQSSTIIKTTKNVNFSTIRDPKAQPFASEHPYTNKFLLKYAGLKDLPIGYILYFIDLCPYLQTINLSQLTLSSDFMIQNDTSTKIPSLIDTVLGNEYEDDQCHYLSDTNVYFKNSHQFIKLYELDVLTYLNKLEHLQSLDLSHITWLNYKNMRGFVQTSKSVLNGCLQTIDLTNSGMIRDLKWAKQFNLEDLKEYFIDEVEKVVVVENEADLLARTIGMDY